MPPTSSNHNTAKNPDDSRPFFFAKLIIRMKYFLVIYAICLAFLNVASFDLMGIYNSKKVLTYVLRDDGKSEFALNGSNLTISPFFKAEKHRFTVPLLYTHEWYVSNKARAGCLIQTEDDKPIQDMSVKLIYKSGDTIVHETEYSFADRRASASNRNYRFESKLEIDVEEHKTFNIEAHVRVNIDGNTDVIVYKGVLNQIKQNYSYWFFEAMAGGT